MTCHGQAWHVIISRLLLLDVLIGRVIVVRRVSSCGILDRLGDKLLPLTQAGWLCGGS